MKAETRLMFALVAPLVQAKESALISSKTFACGALSKAIAYSVYVPSGPAPEAGWPLVLLLHGAGRNHRTIVDDPVCSRIVQGQKFVIVFVNGELGWYIDSPVEPASRYQSMLWEVLSLARKTLPVSSAPRHTGICGWSMGGYGSMRFAQTFPAEIGAVATSIALLDFPNPVLPKEQNFPVSPLFGVDQVTWARMNCMGSIEKVRGMPLFIGMGTTAFDSQMNRNFHAKLEASGITHVYREFQGGHTFSIVQESLPYMFAFLHEHLSQK
jgi:S-formylglutathione hydrolase FrmB